MREQQLVDDLDSTSFLERATAGDSEGGEWESGRHSGRELAVGERRKGERKSTARVVRKRAVAQHVSSRLQGSSQAYGACRYVFVSREYPLVLAVLKSPTVMKLSLRAARSFRRASLGRVQQDQQDHEANKQPATRELRNEEPRRTVLEKLYQYSAQASSGKTSFIMAQCSYAPLSCASSNLPTVRSLTNSILFVPLRSISN